MTRQGDFGARSGLGVSVWGGGEYQRPLSERLRLRVGSDLAVREYPGGDFDQTFLAAHAGPRWLLGPITDISLLATAQRQWLGGRPYIDESGARLEIDRRLLPRLAARGTVALRQRNCLLHCDFRDGPINDVTVALAWTPAPVLRVHMTVGYTRDGATLEHWRSLSRWARVGTSLALPLGFTLGTSVQVKPRLLRRRRPGTPDAKRQAAARSHPLVQPLGPQPRPHRVRLQPAAGADPRGAADERAGAGLRPQPRRVALRAAVLGRGHANVSCVGRISRAAA